MFGMALQTDVVQTMIRRRKEREEIRQWKKGYYHLSTDGWKEGRLFHTASQYAYGMIVMGLVTLLFDVKIYSFSLMPNHVHMILSGTGAACLDVFDYLRQKFSDRLIKDGYPALPDDYWFKLVPIEDEQQMKNVFIYVDRNAYEKQISVPCGYPWSSGPLHYSLLGTLLTGQRADTFSKRKLIEMTGSSKPIPPDWEFHPAIGLLPCSFVDNRLFLRLFKSPKEYESRLVKDYEAFVQVARTLDEVPDYSEEDYVIIVDQMLERKFSGRGLWQLSNEEKGRLAVDLMKNYDMSVPQIAQAIKMSEHMVRQFLRAKDFGHQR